MWTKYAVRYIKSNKGNSVFLSVISFIATAFISLICSMYYNAWMDHIAQIVMKEGSYTSRQEPLAVAYGFVVVAACISLIFMIHNAFEVPMNSRIHQLGILQSVGATPRQIKNFLIQETMILCAAPLVLGVIAGNVFSYVLFQIITGSTDNIRTYEVQFYFHIMVVILSLLASGLTIFISAWIPARKLSRITPLNALNYGTDVNDFKIKRFPSVARLFGIYGELAQKSLYAKRRQLRTSTISLAFAFLALIGLLNIETISTISTQYTYFERFRDKYDLVLTTEGEQLELLGQIEEMKGVESCIAYQKATTITQIAKQDFSQELQIADIQKLNDSFIFDTDETYQFQVPVYILDDVSFGVYCNENHISTEGIVAINHIWDSVNSSRKNRTYIPLVDTAKPLSINVGGNSFKIDAFAEEMPRLKEEYVQYSLSLILSKSFYDNIGCALPLEGSIYNIFLESADYDEDVQKQLQEICKDQEKCEILSRKNEEKSETQIKQTLRGFIYCFAGFLALISIVNMFSFTLGQIYQRRKEFARYFSIGLSPRGMTKMLSMEAGIICFRPLLLSVLINIPLLIVTLSAAEISFSEFMNQAPVFPIAIFAFITYLLIILAYYLGGKKVCSCDFVEVIKDETML